MTTSTTTKTEYTIEHLLTALQVIEEMPDTPWNIPAAIRVTLMDMGLDMGQATTIECTAFVIDELGIEI